MTTMIKPEGWVKYLAQPRTLADINRHSRRSLTLEQTRSLQLPPDYALFEQKNDRGDSVFLAVKQEEKPPNRRWHLWMAAGRMPYIWVQFPETYQHERIRIVPLSDVHYGAKAHTTDRFISYINWIAKNDDVFTFLNGDLIENAIDGSIGGAVYESKLTPEEQIWGTGDGQQPGIIDLLKPIAHKILWALPGNHEQRTTKKTSIDPLRIICRELKVPYLSEPVYADVLAWGKRFTFFCQHGSTNSNTKGGKLNAATRPVEFQEAIDFIVMGHVHDSAVNQTTRIARKRTYGRNGAVASFSIEEHTQYIVICPSFYRFFNSYASRAGYSPCSWGSVNCTINKDGTYRASE